jgi:hypothetical protein
MALLEVPDGGNTGSRQAAWDRSELARVEELGHFAWINACTLWSLHSALDDLVERYAPSVAQVLSGLTVEQAMQRIEADHPERAAKVPNEVRVDRHRASGLVDEGQLQDRQAPREWV